MKKALPLLFLLCFFLIPESLQAQHADFILGIESGMGIRSLKGYLEQTAVGQTSMGIGQAAGISLQHYISNEVSIKTSLLYARKGAKSIWEDLDVNGNRLFFQSSSLDFIYISMPLLFRYEWGKRVRYFANLGSFVSVLLGNPYERFGSNLDLTYDFSSLDLGMSSGLGIQFPLQKKLHVSLELRNDLGLFDISNFSFRSSSNGPLQTRSTNLLIGVFWRLR